MQLLERDDHLATLDTALADVRGSGRGQLVLLGGEAGAGKTALARAFAESNPSVPALAGACEALFTPRPLGPLLDIAAEVGGELGDLTDRGASAGEVLNALARTLRGASMVILEDLHWADEATLDLVHLLGRRVTRLPALVIATYRDDELDRDHPLRVVLGDLTAAERLTVQPLSQAAVAKLAPEGVDAGALHARTGGNAFYVTEVLARHDAGTPGSVRDAVLARAARLNPNARRLLDAVAIARPRAEIWLLEEIAATELPEMEGCVASGMLRSDGDAVAFRHEIARTIIEDELPPDRRVALHRAALGALVGRGEPARLAHHAEAADDAALVLVYSEQAGDRAARLGAHREAAAHFAAALVHAEGAARAALLERRTQECFLSGMIDEAVEAVTDALEIRVATGDRLREGDAYNWLSRLAWYQGDGVRVWDAGLTAIEILEGLPPSRALAQAYSARATRHVMDFDLAGAREWGEKAIGVAEGLGDTDMVVGALRNVATAEMTHERPEGREKLLRSLDLALENGLEAHAAVAYCNLVSTCHDIRDYDCAIAHLEAGRAYCDAHDLLAWHTYLGGWEARIALDRGRWAHAAALAGANLQRTRPGTLPHSRFGSLLVVGVVHARRGDADPWPALDELHDIAVRVDELERLAASAVARAEARWLAGEADRIAEETDVAMARAEASGHRWVVGEIAVWRHRAAIPTAADRLAPPYRAEVVDDLRTAAEFWISCGCRYFAALALAGSDDEDDLRKSLAELQALGARPAAAIVARRLREQGARNVQLGPRASTRANPAGLTARQLDVLDLLAQGDRNADIAAKLFLSEKTVDHHVSAILRKLGVHTRGQAAAEATRLGIAGK